MGLMLTALVREILVREGVPYLRACELSNEVDARVNASAWLVTLNGTTFDKGYDPTTDPRLAPGQRAIHVGPK